MKLDDPEFWTRGNEGAPPHIKAMWDREDWSTYPNEMPDHWDEAEQKWKNADGKDYEGPDQTHFWNRLTGTWELPEAAGSISPDVTIQE